jgi:hypothetical protein
VYPEVTKIGGRSTIFLENFPKSLSKKNNIFDYWVGVTPLPLTLSKMGTDFCSRIGTNYGYPDYFILCMFSVMAN